MSGTGGKRTVAEIGKVNDIPTSKDGAEESGTIKLA